MMKDASVKPDVEQVWSANEVIGQGKRAQRSESELQQLRGRIR